MTTNNDTLLNIFTDELKANQLPAVDVNSVAGKEFKAKIEQFLEYCRNPEFVWEREDLGKDAPHNLVDIAKKYYNATGHQTEFQPIVTATDRFSSSDAFRQLDPLAKQRDAYEFKVELIRNIAQEEGLAVDSNTAAGQKFMQAAQKYVEANLTSPDSREAAPQQLFGALLNYQKETNQEITSTKVNTAQRVAERVSEGRAFGNIDAERMTEIDRGARAFVETRAASQGLSSIVTHAENADPTRSPWAARVQAETAKAKGGIGGV